MHLPAATLAILVVATNTADAGTCVKLDKATATQTSATKRTAESFAKALAARKLSSVTLPLHSWKPGIPSPQMEKVVDRQEAGKSVHLVTMGTSQLRCGDPSFEFVQTGSKIYRVVRMPKTKRTVVAVCGCPEVKYCGGGAQPAASAIGYELPAGASYEGRIEIAYDFDEVVFDYPALPTCKMPSPPP